MKWLQSKKQTRTLPSIRGIFICDFNFDENCLEKTFGDNNTCSAMPF